MKCHVNSQNTVSQQGVLNGHA
uniref:Uncharacterized protein n=1 Tax=Arundo donax TaxID=35708 RepID=A0A0A9FWS4_ARUDO